MADKRDLKIKTHKHMTGEREPSPMAWERSPKKRIVRIKKAEEPKKATVAMTMDETEAADIPLPTQRKKRSSAGRRLLLRLAAMLLAVVVALTIWQHWDSLAPRNLMFWIDQTFSTSGDGFPVEISGNTVLDVQQVQSYMVLLTDTSLVAFNASGGEVMRRQHNYSDPILLISGRYMLVAEVGGKRFRLETLPDTVLNVTSDNLSEDKKTSVLDTALENSIISADVGSDGTVALVTASSGSYTSEVLVYSSSGKLKYRQRYVSVQAIDVALSANQREVAVIGIEGNHGVLQSSLRVYSLRSQDTTPLKEYTGQDVMLCRVAYLDTAEIVAIGDTQTWVVDGNGDQDKRISYDQQLVGYAIGDKAVGLALQKYGAGDGGELMWLDRRGETAYTAAFSGDFRHLTIVDNEALLLTAGQLYRGNSTGLNGSTEVQQDGRMVGRIGKNAIVLGLTSLTEYTLPTV